MGVGGRQPSRRPEDPAARPTSRRVAGRNDLVNSRMPHADRAPPTIATGERGNQHARDQGSTPTVMRPARDSPPQHGGPCAARRRQPPVAMRRAGRSASPGGRGVGGQDGEADPAEPGHHQRKPGSTAPPRPGPASQRTEGSRPRCRPRRRRPSRWPPTSPASASTSRRTCRRLPPMHLVRAMCRRRWVSRMVKVLAMTMPDATTAVTANPSSTMVKTVAPPVMSDQSLGDLLVRGEHRRRRRSAAAITSAAGRRTVPGSAIATMVPYRGRGEMSVDQLRRREGLTLGAAECGGRGVGDADDGHR